MAAGLPTGWPYPPPTFAAPPAGGVIDRDDDLLTGLAVVGGGVVVTVGLIAWVAVANSRDHDRLRGEIDEGAEALEGYRRAHAETHARLQDQLMALDSGVAALDAEVASLALRRPSIRVPTTLASTISAAPTMYALPMSYSAAAYGGLPGPAVAPLASAYPTEPYLVTPALAPPSAPVAVSLSPLVLPSHIAAAVETASRRSHARPRTTQARTSRARTSA